MGIGIVVVALFTEFTDAFNLVFRKALWKAEKSYNVLDKTVSI